MFYDANCLYCCLLFYGRPWRDWIRPKCGNEMSCLRRHWTTRQRTYRICRVILGDYIRIYTCVRYATGKQLNTYIDTYAGRTYEHLYLPLRIQATLNARITTAVKAFLKPYALRISQSLLRNLLRLFSIVIMKSEHCNIILWPILYKSSCRFVQIELV